MRGNDRGGMLRIGGAMNEPSQSVKLDELFRQLGRTKDQCICGKKAGVWWPGYALCIPCANRMIKLPTKAARQVEL